MVKKKKHEHQVLTSYMKKIDDSLLKIHYKIAELNARISQIEKQLNRIEQYINGIYNRLTKLELETSFLVEREKEPFWRKVRRRIRELWVKQ